MQILLNLFKCIFPFVLFVLIAAYRGGQSSQCSHEHWRCHSFHQWHFYWKHEPPWGPEQDKSLHRYPQPHSAEVRVYRPVRPEVTQTLKHNVFETENHERTNSPGPVWRVLTELGDCFGLKTGFQWKMCALFTLRLRKVEVLKRVSSLVEGLEDWDPAAWGECGSCLKKGWYDEWEASGQKNTPT